jgi:hypothetical protein
MQFSATLALVTFMFYAFFLRVVRMSKLTTWLDLSALPATLAECPPLPNFWLMRRSFLEKENTMDILLSAHYKC